MLTLNSFVSCKDCQESSDELDIINGNKRFC